jgi:hypothetical protein
MTDAKLTPEEQWFLEKEAHRRERLRDELERKATEEQRKREIAGTLGTDNQAVVERIAALGLDGKVVRVLHLLPMVKVAWADGAVSISERRTILEAVEANGIAPGSEAAIFITSLLESRPSETLLNEILAIVKDILAVQGLKANSLLEACQHVATASGGLLGLGNKVSDEEAEAIHKVAKALGPAADERVSQELG